MKQLEVRNTPGGMIWQIYHVNENIPSEQELLTRAANLNGFTSVRIRDELTEEETWPGWRDTPEWKAYCQREGTAVA